MTNKKMPKNPFVFLFIAITALLATPLQGIAQEVAPGNYPIHILVETTKVGPEKAMPDYAPHVLIPFEGTIKEIYKNDPSAKNYQSLALHAPIKFDLTCYPPAPPNTARWSDDPSPDCEPLQKASIIEIWAFPSVNGNPLSVDRAKPQ